MSNFLAISCAIAFLVSAPALLVARALWPHRIAWPTVVVAAAAFGWIFLNVGQHFARLMMAGCPELWSRLYEAADCVEVIAHYPKTYNLVIGWLKGIAYLLPWLAVYAIVHSIRVRRRLRATSPPNTSFERTREG